MADEIGFAIVGLRRGYQAAKEVAQTSGARLVAVADLDLPRAQEVAQELGCEWTADCRELLRRDDIHREFGTPPEREVALPPEVNPPANRREDVVGALTRGTKVACDGIEGRRSVLVNNAIYESARTGKPVKVNE